MNKISQINHVYTFECDSNFYVGTPMEIIIQMKHIEWGETPSAIQYKQRVTKRARIFGKEIEYFDAFSFLCSVERHGLGRFCANDKKLFF